MGKLVLHEAGDDIEEANRQLAELVSKKGTEIVSVFSHEGKFVALVRERETRTTNAGQLLG